MKLLIESAFVLIALTLTLLACSSAEPEGGDLVDPLSIELWRVAAEIPAFGGIGYDESVRDEFGSSLLVLYTLGEDPAAEAEIRRRVGSFNPLHYTVRTRPAQGEGSAELADQIAEVVSFQIYESRVAYDSTTGYVRVGTLTINTAAINFYDLVQAGIPLEDVIIQVENRPRTL